MITIIILIMIIIIIMIIINIPWELDTHNSIGFRFTNRSANSGQKKDIGITYKKKWPCRIVDFGVPVDYKVKIKQKRKQNKYFKLTPKLKKIMVGKNDSGTTCSRYAENSPKTW